MSAPDPFQDLVDALCRTLTSTSTTTPPPPAPTSAFPAESPSPSAVASPMAKPAPFSGSAEDCNGFLLQCSMVLEMQPHLYPNDSSKVAFIISQLDGKALRWTEPFWSQKNPIVQSLSSFTAHFKEVFGKPAWDSSIVNALLDSGSAGNFISGALCRQLQLKTTAMLKIYQIYSVTGRPLRQVRYSVGPLQLQIGILHTEEIHLLVLEDSTADVEDRRDPEVG
ncbi:Retrotransposon Gag-like protein 8 [Anabarilius grahami]|uniref:Retrotransposon Gag-like protein 8 n=1 Tax=Anabarilius grahami TaxID=495550 RepID=A0A3N0Y5I3_ANAGA|nr:Retrotransposon Gag-like protein 8 [Anabarilius grahami]